LLRRAGRGRYIGPQPCFKAQDTRRLAQPATGPLE
jgi:hypothetical protein